MDKILLHCEQSLLGLVGLLT